MPTPIFICGAECGLASLGAASGGVEHWSSVVSNPSVVTSGPSPMLSTRCFRFNPTASQVNLTHTFASAVSYPPSPQIVASFDIYFATLPSASVTFFKMLSHNHGVGYDPADGKIYPFNGLIKGATGASVTTGVWYHIDVRVVVGSPALIDLQVNGAALPQFSFSASASSESGVVVGWSQQNVTADCYIDNIVVSATSADYPLSNVKVAGLYPNGDVTNNEASGAPPDNGGHRYSSVSAFGKGAGGATNLAAQNVESTSWQSLQNPLSTTIPTNFIADKAGTSSEYLVWTLGDLPANANQIHGAMLVATTHSAATQANSFQLAIKAGSANDLTGYGQISADLSETTITVPVQILGTGGGGNALDTVAKVNAAIALFASSDVNPDVYLDGVCMEVAYVADTGLSGPISPAIFTVTPVALTTIGSGDASRTLTSAALTLSPVALVRSVGTATTSISPATITLTPTALTGQATIDPQFASISPVVMTLSPQPVATSVGGASRSVSPVSLSLAPVVLTRSVGDVARTLGIVTISLTPIVLTQSVGGVSLSISSVTLTLTPVALTRGTDTSARTLTPVTVSLVAVSLITSVGSVSQTLSPVGLSLIPVELVPLILVPQSGSISPVIFTLTPVVITNSVGGVTTSVSPALLTLSAIAITRSVGTAASSISSITVTLIPVALTTLVGGTASVSISPVIFTLGAITLTRSVGGTATVFITPVVMTMSVITLTRSLGTSSASVSPATITVIPVALTRSVGNTTASINPVTLTLTGYVLTGFAATPGTGNILPVIISLVPRPLTTSVGGTATTSITPVAMTFTAVTLSGAAATPNVSSISPVLISLVPVTLVRSVGGISRSISSVTLTLTAVVLTRSVGTSAYTITPITLTITPTSLGYLVGGTAIVINPILMTFIAFALSPVFGGKPYSWTGTNWITKPVRMWTGSEWIEKPMKVWTGSEWVLV